MASHVRSGSKDKGGGTRRLLGRGGVRFPLDGKPCLTEYQALGHTRSAQHNWVTTVMLHPHTGVHYGSSSLSQELWLIQSDIP